MSKVSVAIIGVGNCASALVQAVHYYRHAADDDLVSGLMHVNLGRYHVRDIEFSAAFDVGPTGWARTSPRPSYDPLCRGAAPGRAGPAQHDARWPGQVPVAGHHQGAGPDH
jgi:hypothetical protein